MPHSSPGPAELPLDEQAMLSVRQAAGAAGQDPLRPVYHFRPPAQWSNDPNGTIFHDGWYHLFYQHNPYDAVWGRLHWGHARSRDLVHWEHLPVAFTPSLEQGEEHCWSGCTVINKAGQPMIFYTSIGPQKPDLDGAEQWAALGSPDLVRWTKHPENPILTDRVNGEVKIYDWRDPYIFTHSDRTYMILGGNLRRRQGGGGVVALYRAENDALTEWKYCGIPFHHIDEDVVQIDCPNLIPLGDKWVLLFSPWHGSIAYFVGTFDPNEPRFTPERSGKFDHGPDLFATNTLVDDQGRWVVLGWVRGYRRRHLWNGCMSLPRELALGMQGELIQRPVRELQGLRRESIRLDPFELNGVRTLPSCSSDTIEMRITFEQINAEQFGLRVFCAADRTAATPILQDRDGVRVADSLIMPIRSLPGETLDLHLFLDKSVLELFLDGGRTTITRTIERRPQDRDVELVALGGSVRVKAFEAWSLAVDGLFSGP